MQLIYAEENRCPCGALLAYKYGTQEWDCSDILLGKAIPKDQPGSKKHTVPLPFAFYKVR